MPSWDPYIKGIYRIEKADESLANEWATVTEGITAGARR